MRVTGVNRMTFFSTPYQNILLFGESHDHPSCKPSEEESVPVSEVIADLALSASSCVDVFLEVSRGSDSLFKEKSQLSATWNKLVPLKKFLPNLRVHEVDTRAIPSEDELLYFPAFPVLTLSTLISSSSQVYSVRDLVSEVFTDSYFEESDFDGLRLRLLVSRGEQQRAALIRQLVPPSDLARVLAYLLMINTEVNRKYFYKLINTLRFLPGEPLTFSNDYIAKWEKAYFTAVNKRFSKMRLVDPETFKVELLRAQLSHAVNSGDFHLKLSLTLVAAPMDVYCLLRLFTNFENKGRRPCDSELVKNVIMYTGSFHTQVYETFLSSLFGPPLLHSETSSEFDLCLSVPKFDFWDV